MLRISCLNLCLLLALLTGPLYGASDQLVKVMRVPEGGIQPQAAVDSKGRIHLIYCTGDPSHGDVLYARSDDNGDHFTNAIRVNSQAQSVIAIGTVRGPQLAIGRNNRVHVAWMGSGMAEPKLMGRESPMLYTRLNDAGDAFEPQRNVIHDHPGLDGGGSVAADRNGNVYVAWHAPSTLRAGEADRHVWVARSSDDGASFAAETDFTPGSTGACGCCGMTLFASSRGDLFALYRSATEMVHRDIYLASSHDSAKSSASTKVGPWEIGACVMSTAAMSGTPDGIAVAAWEQRGNIVMCDIAPGETTPQHVMPIPGTAKNRKHPSVAVAAGGKRLIAWTEGTAWARGGAVAWQIFDEHGTEVDQAGHIDGMPMWDRPAAVATSDGRFLILY